MLLGVIGTGIGIVGLLMGIGALAAWANSAAVKSASNKIVNGIEKEKWEQELKADADASFNDEYADENNERYAADGTDPIDIPIKQYETDAELAGTMSNIWDATNRLEAKNPGLANTHANLWENANQNAKQYAEELPNLETKPLEQEGNKTEITDIPQAGTATAGIQEEPNPSLASTHTNLWNNANSKAAEYEASLPPQNIPSKEEPTIKDTTEENQEISIDTSGLQAIIDQVNKDYADRIAREDAIRKETQEREDNAYQRAVADMRKAGINPNLVNLAQAASGGGITQASQKDYTIWESEVNKQLALLEQQIQNNFQGTENDKKNFVSAIGTLVTLFAIGARMK